MGWFETALASFNQLEPAIDNFFVYSGKGGRTGTVGKRRRR